MSLPFAPSSLAFARSASQETAAKGFIDFFSVELRAFRRDRGRERLLFSPGEREGGSLATARPHQSRGDGGMDGEQRGRV